MLYFDRIYVSEGINVNKINASKECNICHYWYFLNYSFKFQPYSQQVSRFDQKKWNIIKNINKLF